MEAHDNEFKEVYFHTYCEQCEHKDIDEENEPCRECLDNPINSYSHKPVKFKEKR